MLQQIIIAVLVAAAAVYVIWMFLPMLRRQKLLDALAAQGLLVGIAARHRARLATPGCSNCSAAAQHTLAHARDPRKAVKSGVET